MFLASDQYHRELLIGASGFLFQSGALWELRMTLSENVALPLAIHQAQPGRDRR